MGKMTINTIFEKYTLLRTMPRKVSTHSQDKLTTSASNKCEKLTLQPDLQT